MPAIREHPDLTIRDYAGSCISLFERNYSVMSSPYDESWHGKLRKPAKKVGTLGAKISYAASERQASFTEWQGEIKW
jgi:hypothetical protein